MRVRWVAVCGCFLLIALVVGSPGSALARNDQHYDESVGFEGDPTGGVIGVDVAGGGGGTQPPGDEAPDPERGVRKERIWTSRLAAALVPTQLLLPSGVLFQLIQHHCLSPIGKR